MSSNLPESVPNPTLTAQQQQVLALLAEGHSVTAAAAEAGVHRNTITNWRRTIPAFTRECEWAIREQAQAWHQHAVSLAPRALQVLDEILNAPDAAPALRLRAALAVLKTAASPQLEPLPTLATTSERLENAWDRHLAHQSRSAAAEPSSAPDSLHNVHVQNVKSRTILHNAPIRRAPEPGRNSQCHCGSGLKFKRCCAPYAPPRAAAPQTASAAAA